MKRMVVILLVAVNQLLSFRILINIYYKLFIIIISGYPIIPELLIFIYYKSYFSEFSIFIRKKSNINIYKYIYIYI